MEHPSWNVDHRGSGPPVPRAMVDMNKLTEIEAFREGESFGSVQG